MTCNFFSLHKLWTCVTHHQKRKCKKTTNKNHIWNDRPHFGGLYDSFSPSSHTKEKASFSGLWKAITYTSTAHCELIWCVLAWGFHTDKGSDNKPLNTVLSGKLWNGQRATSASFSSDVDIFTSSVSCSTCFDCAKQSKLTQVRNNNQIIRRIFIYKECTTWLHTLRGWERHDVLLPVPQCSQYHTNEYWLSHTVLHTF